MYNIFIMMPVIVNRLATISLNGFISKVVFKVIGQYFQSNLHPNVCPTIKFTFKIDQIVTLLILLRDCSVGH